MPEDADGDRIVKKAKDGPDESGLTPMDQIWLSQVECAQILGVCPLMPRSAQGKTDAMKIRFKTLDLIKVGTSARALQVMIDKIGIVCQDQIGWIPIAVLEALDVAVKMVSDGMDGGRSLDPDLLHNLVKVSEFKSVSDPDHEV